MIRLFLNLLIALDCALNAAVCGDPYETLSSRCGKHYPALARFINFVMRDPQHCARSLRPEAGSHAVPGRDHYKAVIFWAVVLVSLIFRP